MENEVLMIHTSIKGSPPPRPGRTEPRLQPQSHDLERLDRGSGRARRSMVTFPDEARRHEAALVAGRGQSDRLQYLVGRRSSSIELRDRSYLIGVLAKARPRNR